jgi:hypothetical protein
MQIIRLHKPTICERRTSSFESMNRCRPEKTSDKATHDLRQNGR